MNYDYNKKPGEKLEIKKYSFKKPIISIIYSIKNNKINIQTLNSILNQSFPNFELLIVGKVKEKIDDKIVKIIESVSDNIFENFNIGFKETKKESKYCVFVKDGFLMERVYLETIYWAMITHEDASWGYSNGIIYGEKNKLFEEFYKEEKGNTFPLFMIKKEVMEEVNGFDVEKDYAVGLSKFWNKIVNKDLIPIHTSCYLSWITYEEYKLYFESKNKLKINNNHKVYSKTKEPIQLPMFNYNYEDIDKPIDNLVIPEVENNTKINILMIVPWIITGGADIFNLELIKRLDKDKYSFTLLSTEPSVNDLRQQFENVADVYDITSFLDVKDYIPFINYIIKKNHINMFFNTSSLYGYSILPYLKANNPEIPIVDYIHMEEWYHRNGGYSRSSSMLDGIIDKTLVCNSKTEEIMKDYFKIKDEEVETVYIGVDTEKFNPEKYNKQELLKKYGLENVNKTIIGYICRISEQKRPMLFAEIIKRTLEKRNDVLFLIVGDGSMKKTLKDAVTNKKYKDNIKFLPSTNKTPEIYKLCDITINCSIKEGLALTSYESLAMGVPVISADVGGQSELVEDYVGKLVPCYQDEKDILNFNYKDEEINSYVDAIDEVIANLDVRKNNCRRKILNKFTLEQMADNMDKQFDYAFNNPKQEKIEVGKSLKNAVGITKELIIASLMEDRDKTNYQCNEFFRKIYESTTTKNIIKKRGLWCKIKERLWKSSIWRKFTKSSIWKFSKKILKRG